MVYIVFFRDKDCDVYDDSEVVGVFTTFTLALEEARSMKTHEDDEWCIKQCELNRKRDIETIWDSYTDETRRTCQVYERFFPAGYPTKAGE